MFYTFSALHITRSKAENLFNTKQSPNYFPASYHHFCHILQSNYVWFQETKTKQTKQLEHKAINKLPRLETPWVPNIQLSGTDNPFGWPLYVPASFPPILHSSLLFCQCRRKHFHCVHTPLIIFHYVPLTSNAYPVPQKISPFPPPIHNNIYTSQSTYLYQALSKELYTCHFT